MQVRKRNEKKARERRARDGRGRPVRHGHCVGGVSSKTYVSWAGMWTRCRNSRAHAFERYGGRGITVCERWRDFRNFLADMGVRPSGMTLDRLNNDGNYEPKNCWWATQKDQQNNRRSRRSAL